MRYYFICIQIYNDNKFDFVTIFTKNKYIFAKKNNANGK